MSLKKLDVPGRATIWCVDDAWFDITGPEGDKMSLHDRLEDQWDEITTVAQLIEALQNMKGGYAANPNLVYLVELAKICDQNEFSLRLCSFDIFPSKFPEINTRKSACLVDVCYEEEDDDAYGVNMVHGNLQGRRPMCDLFFVTSTPVVVRDRLAQNARDPMWWPVRTVPTVEKPDWTGADSLEVLKGELNTFANYFKMGIEDGELRDLLRALIDSATMTHPDSASDLMILPESFPLLETFLTQFNDNVDSYKALYFRWPLQGRRWDARHPIAMPLLVEMMHKLGIEVDGGDVTDLMLPFTPGMLFLVYLVQFLRAVEVVQMSIRKVMEGSLVRYELRVPLHDPAAFRADFFGKDGSNSVAKLRDLLSCRGDLLVDMFGKSYDRTLADWHDPTRLSGPLGSWVHEIVADVSFEMDHLVLWWTASANERHGH